MRDFTLYLYDLDALSFNKVKSRHGQDSLAHEWDAAWRSYSEHLNEFEGEVDSTLLQFARDEWRQDLSSPYCIRNKIIDVELHDLWRGRASVIVRNPDMASALKFDYEELFHFCVMDTARNSEYPNPLAEHDASLYLQAEELRFSGKDIEHEFIFLGGWRLLIGAKKISANIAEYRDK